MTMGARRAAAPCCDRVVVDWAARTARESGRRACRARRQSRSCCASCRCPSKPSALASVRICRGPAVCAFAAASQCAHAELEERLTCLEVRAVGMHGDCCGFGKGRSGKAVVAPAWRFLKEGPNRLVVQPSTGRASLAARQLAPEAGGCLRMPRLRMPRLAKVRCLRRPGLRERLRLPADRGHRKPRISLQTVSKRDETDTN